MKRLILHAVRLAACVALVGGQANAAAARDFLWKVSGTTGSLYLVGSVHLLTKDFYPLSPTLESAFKESDLLVEEADLAEMLSPQSMTVRGSFARSLASVLGSESPAYFGAGHFHWPGSQRYVTSTCS